MINQNKWINSLPKSKSESINVENQLDHERWINTIPQKKTYIPVKKYFLTVTLFICGLLFVSAIKNEARNLQKEINNFKASINLIKFNLDQAILDNEVITSPKNIALLAKEYLNSDFVSYKRSQIKELNAENKFFTEEDKIAKKEINKLKIQNLPKEIKSKVVKRIEQKKAEINKLKKLYKDPKSIPNEVKTKIGEKKVELEQIYKSPYDVITLERVGRWSVVQVVKIFLGMPVIPGR